MNIEDICIVAGYDQRWCVQHSSPIPADSVICRKLASRDSSYECADCGKFTATVYLPEGRYLCKSCWDQLRELREAVVADSARRQRARAFMSRKDIG